MSQKTTRKGVAEEKEKRQTDSPVKDMKKKMAANAEKEKQAAAAEKSEAQSEKSTDKQEKTTKQAEKPAEKTPEKSKDDKKAEKNDKAEKDKKNDKPAETKEAEKKEAEKPKDDKADKNTKKKQNGHGDASTNGAGLNGTEPELNGDGELNGRVSDEDLEHEDDELFPELTYDDSEDSFEPPTPDGAPSRSFTRRSQAKPTRTPETPRPASAKHDATEDSKESKVLKMKDDPLATDRKLRSADSPKPESKKDKADKKEESQEKKGDSQEKKGESQEKGEEKKEAQNDESKDKSEGKDEKGDKKESEKDKEKMEVEVVIDVDAEPEGSRKPDTNFSKSRVKVSPYRRSMRLADQTTSSVMANYTGNNTTMEMDITETSSFMGEEPSLDDSYLSGLRSIRGRRSYKPLKEMTLRSITSNRSIRSTTSVSVSDHPSRPTGTVVGRKRKPDCDDVELAAEVAECDVTHGKRMRLLDRIAHPFRRAAVPHAGVSRRAAEIVGINTDLPLTAPVASPDTFDPESLKPAPAVVTPPPAVSTDRDAKRCVVM